MLCFLRLLNLLKIKSHFDLLLLKWKHYMFSVWFFLGEKASIAAKSAVHGSLHYLNKTIFNDLKPFENLTIKTDESSISNTSLLDEKTNLVSNTREVFVCLLRAFNCAHDLILENKVKTIILVSGSLMWKILLDLN